MLTASRLEELGIWQKDIEKEAETLENNGFTLVLADESHQNSNIFGSSAVYVRSAAEPVPTPPGNQRQTIYGGVTRRADMFHGIQKGKQQIANQVWTNRGVASTSQPSSLTTPRTTTRGASAVSGKDGGFVKLRFLLPYSPLLNPAE